MKGPCLHTEHVGVLTLVLLSLFAGEMPPGSLSARVERGDDGVPVIVWRKGYTLFGDVDGLTAGKMEGILGHLARNGWLTVSGRGELRIGLGPRSRRVFAKAAR